MAAELEVEPGGVADVVEADPGGLEGHTVCSGEASGHHEEREVVAERASGQQVDADVGGAPTREGLGPLVGGLAACGVVLVVGREPYGDRDVGRRRCDGVVLAQPQLVSVVAEGPAEVVQDRPGLVAGGAAQAVFPREGGKGLGATWY